MASLDELIQAHAKDISYYGYSFNPRPEPDTFGRRQATPMEVVKAINGEFNLPEDKVVFKRKKKR